MRIWPIIVTEHNSFRPTYLDRETNALKTVEDLQDKSGKLWTIWLEAVDTETRTLIPFDIDTQCLVFFKLFLPEKNAVIYFSYHFVPYDTSISMCFILR